MHLLHANVGSRATVRVSAVAAVSLAAPEIGAVFGEALGRVGFVDAVVLHDLQRLFSSLPQCFKGIALQDYVQSGQPDLR
ncbi:hypothetical protein ABZ511_22580 [Nocardia gamkensis]|uniref:hypothetical protein n=1 Tax=Nocardia TaxID=1817 RepID=UPI003408F4D0